LFKDRTNKYKMKHIRIFIISLGIFLLHFQANAQGCEKLSDFEKEGYSNKLSLILIDINPEQLCEQLDITNFENKFHFYVVNISELEHLKKIASGIIENNKKLELPSLLFINKEKQLIQSFHGTRTSEEIRLLLEYFGNEYYEHIPWCKFKKIHD